MIHMPAAAAAAATAARFSALDLTNQSTLEADHLAAFLQHLYLSLLWAACRRTG